LGGNACCFFFPSPPPLPFSSASVMELAADVLAGLRFAGGSDVSDDIFVPIVKGTFQVVAGGADEAEALGPAAGAGADALTLKSMFDSLSALVLEAARLNTEADAVRTFLVEEASWAPARADGVAKAYERAVPQLRSRLAMVTSCTLPQVVEVDWRLDYHIKGNTLERANQLSYLVKLKTRGNVPLAEVEHDDEDRRTSGADGEVQFSCSVEQLQDLVTKLKDAVKQMERSGTIS
jgi:COMM domain containing 3